MPNIMRTITALFIILCPSLVFAADWPSLYRDFTNRNSVLEQVEYPLTETGSVPSDFTIVPVTQGDIVITAQSTTFGNKILAYRLSTLELLWEFQLGTNTPKQPLIYRGTVYFGLANKPIVFAALLTNGQQLWQTTLSNSTVIRFAPIVIDDHLFVVGSLLYKLSLDGALVWSKTYNITSPPATDSEGIFFRTQGQTIVRLDPTTGNELWHYATGTTAGTQPVLTAQGLFIGTSQKVIGLDKVTGSLLWQYDTGATAPLIGSVATVGQRILFSTNFGDLRALSDTGQLLWSVRFNTDSNAGNGWRAPFVVSGDKVLAEANQTETIILNAIDGAIVDRSVSPAPGGVFRVVSQDKLFVSSSNRTYIYIADHWSSGSLGDPPGQKRIDPVVIIPGILESWPINGEWKLDPVFHIFDGLKAGLHEAGYQDNLTLFEFPYDWHQSNTITGEILHQKITEIRTQTGANKVDIVAHSMGGLVARSYIQGLTYENDVDELITIGTPHHGSVKAYLTWEAGETGTSIVDTVKRKFIDYEAKESDFGVDSVAYIHSRMTSVKDLLPIFDYLKSSDQVLAYSPCSESTYPCNNFLEALSDIVRLTSKVNILNVVGKMSEDTTLKELTITDSNVLNKWFHGYPIGYPNSTGVTNGKGDGTVLYSSAHIDGVNEMVYASDHMKIVADSARDIAKQLTTKSVTSYQWIEPSRYLFIRLYSPVDMIITDPNDQRVGTDPVTNEITNEIPTAFYSGNQSGEEYAIISDPIDGLYSIKLSGTNFGNYEIEESMVSNSGSSDTLISGETDNGKTDLYSLSISGNSSTLDYIPPLPSPAPSPSPEPSPLLSPSPIPSINGEHKNASCRKFDKTVNGKWIRDYCSANY